eukprot:15470603-Alexandrium_andersonii.AAC.2
MPTATYTCASAGRAEDGAQCPGLLPAGGQDGSPPGLLGRERGNGWVKGDLGLVLRAAVGSADADGGGRATAGVAAAVALLREL